MEAHLRQLKKQHATQLQDLQLLLDRQSDQVDSLLADQQTHKAQYMQAKREISAATAQLDSTRQRLMKAKQEADAERVEKLQFQDALQTLEQVDQQSSQAVTAAVDRESNLQQQIATLKRQLKDSSNNDELQILHQQLGLARQEVLSLKAQTEAGGYTCL